ncbi:MAG: hypothetical protein EXR27_05935 [Betaproteobacteria bacterium]|nr:hypothetical protein [Betaproteobacteria bacterium]
MTALLRVPLLRLIGPVLLALLEACAPACAAGANPAIASIAIYYGAEPPWDELAAFDIAVVEADHAGSVKNRPDLAGARTVAWRAEFRGFGATVKI